MLLIVSLSTARKSFSEQCSKLHTQKINYDTYLYVEHQKMNEPVTKIEPYFNARPNV